MRMTIFNPQFRTLSIYFFSQLRLDFNTFAITGPSTTTDTNSQTKIINGSPNSLAGTPALLASQCLTDTFSVTNSGSSAPMICGTNSGEHSNVF